MRERKPAERNDPMTSPADRFDLQEAAAGLAGVAVRTPLLALSGLAAPVRIKAENLQPVGAFKLRGAWTALRRLPGERRSRGVVTSSSGNHGLALAWAARRLGIPAVVVMPESAPKLKQRGVLDAGAELRLVGAVRGPEQTAAAEAIAAGTGMTMIPPYDHPDVIAGQATCAMEIIEEWPEVETIVSPVGGGGLLAGTCLAVAASGRPISVVAVEPAPIPKLSSALAAGAPVDLPSARSLADGLLTRSVGDLTWPIIAAAGVRVVGVDDEQIRNAMRRLDRLELRPEPSGAVTTAAVLSGALELTGPTALILSGGNVDPGRYDELVA